MDMQHFMDMTSRIAIIGDNTLMVLGLRGLLESLMPTIEVGTYSTVTELHAAERLGKHFFHYFVMTRALLADTSFFTRHSKRCIVLVDNNTSLLPANFHTLDMSQPEGQLIRDLILLQHRGHKGRSVPQAAHPHLVPKKEKSSEPTHAERLYREKLYEHNGATPLFTSHPDIIPPNDMSQVALYATHMATSEHEVQPSYIHPDILPPSGLPSDQHRQIPCYATGSIHPDIIDLGVPVSSEVVMSNHSPVSPEVLTNREREVLIYIVKGFTNKEIARQLNIGLTTIITHRRNLIEKLAIRSISALTVYAVTHGLVPIEDIDT